jgi:hypothetical protein
VEIERGPVCLEFFEAVACKVSKYFETVKEVVLAKRLRRIDNVVCSCECGIVRGEDAFD